MTVCSSSSTPLGFLTLYRIWYSVHYSAGCGLSMQVHVCTLYVYVHCTCMYIHCTCMYIVHVVQWYICVSEKTLKMKCYLAEFQRFCLKGQMYGLPLRRTRTLWRSRESCRPSSSLSSCREFTMPSWRCMGREGPCNQLWNEADYIPNTWVSGVAL